jgi:hypothetical protein
MKRFDVTLSRDLRYTEEAIVTIKADTEEGAREFAECCFSEEDVHWKIVRSSWAIEDESITDVVEEVVSEQEKLLQMPTQGIYLN